MTKINDITATAKVNLLICSLYHIRTYLHIYFYIFTYYIIFYFIFTYSFAHIRRVKKMLISILVVILFRVIDSWYFIFVRTTLQYCVASLYC